MLEEHAVRRATKQSYTKIWEAFLTFARLHMLATEPIAKMDAAMAEYLESLYFEGYDASAGSRLIAAVGFFVPGVSRHGEIKLPRARMACQGWAILSPLKARLPYPSQ